MQLTNHLQGPVNRGATGGDVTTKAPGKLSLSSRDLFLLIHLSDKTEYLKIIRSYKYESVSKWRLVVMEGYDTLFLIVTSRA